MATLRLAPLYTSQFVSTAQEAAIVSRVQQEFFDPHTRIEFSDWRGERNFKVTMNITRTLGTLPPKQQFTLKWMRMADYAGIPYALNGSEYQEYMLQMYLGSLNGDNQASVNFTSSHNAGSWFEDNRDMVTKKCLEHFTPHFSDVLNEVMGQVTQHIQHFSGGAFAQWGQRMLGVPSSSSPQGGGWATSR